MCEPETPQNLLAEPRTLSAAGVKVLSDNCMDKQQQTSPLSPAVLNSLAGSGDHGTTRLSTPYALQVGPNDLHAALLRLHERNERLLAQNKNLQQALDDRVGSPS